jgi:hypothetical protein
MSVKIYRGFKLETDSFQEALQIVNAFRPWVEKQAEAVMDKFIENAKAAYKGESTSETDIKIECFDLWNNLRQKILKEKGLKAPHIDTEFNVVLIPTQNIVLGIVYTAHNEWYNAWCEHPGVKEYYYWNNADKPDEISEEEWEKRESDWQVLDYKPTSMQGFSIELVDPMGPMPEFLRHK